MKKPYFGALGWPNKKKERKRNNVISKSTNMTTTITSTWCSQSSWPFLLYSHFWSDSNSEVMQTPRHDLCTRNRGLFSPCLWCGRNRVIILHFFFFFFLHNTWHLRFLVERRVCTHNQYPCGQQAESYFIFRGLPGVQYWHEAPVTAVPQRCHLRAYLLTPFAISAILSCSQ